MVFSLGDLLFGEVEIITTEITDIWLIKILKKTTSTFRNLDLVCMM